MTHPLTVALVNNMPDQAFLDTERQFRSALGAAAGDRLRLELYTMSGLTRSAAVTDEIGARYRSLDRLWREPPDALVLTGTEPVQAELASEPYWPQLAQILEWASAHVPTTLLSCLAAHASLLLFDGLQRQPLAEKCCGVFAGRVDPSATDLAAGLAEVVKLPHSRVNDIPEAQLRAAGYQVVIGGGDSGPGWSVASKSHGISRFVLCQGHPEYGTESLLREYRRDVRRYLFGHGAAAYPTRPDGYFNPEATRLLTDFAEVAQASQPADAAAVVATFPYAAVAATLTNAWSGAAAGFYRNWVALASRRAATGQPVRRRGPGAGP